MNRPPEDLLQKSPKFERSTFLSNMRPPFRNFQFVRVAKFCGSMRGLCAPQLWASF
jgi:hypothetical protein